MATSALQSNRIAADLAQDRTRFGAAPPRSFLDGLELQHGPIPLLGRFFLDADAYLRKCGISVSFDGIAAIASTNSANQSSWGRFAPQLDTTAVDLTEAESYCMVGRSPSGTTVAIQGGRIYDTGHRSLQDCAADRSIYYGSTPPPDGGYSCTLTAPSSRHISGRYVFSGGLWVHPNYRGARLACLLPRMSRAYALGLWNTKFTYTFIGEKLAASPLPQMYGYKLVEPGYTVYENGSPFYAGSLLWMERSELVADIEDFMSSGFFEADRGIARGGRNDARVAAR